MKFKHGTTLHQNGGYPRLSVGPQRYRYIHVLVAEGMLQRSLRPDERVHHVDGDVKNPNKNTIPSEPPGGHIST